MGLPKIERIKTAFIEGLIGSGAYSLSDSVVTGVSDDFPAILYQRDEPVPVLSRTTAIFSLRDPIGFIDRIFINRGLRKTGLATSIYTAIEQAFRRNGVTALALYARKNPQAETDPQAFWKNRGLKLLTGPIFPVKKS